MKGANNYLRNVAKSMTYAAVDVANEELMSETIDFAKNNKEFIAATYAALRNPAAALKRSIKAIQQSKIYQALDYGVKNTFEDLRTGNFYNKEREERDVGKLSGIDASDYNDLSEFGIDDDWESMLNDDGGGRSKSSKVTKEITSGDLEIIESIEGSNAAAANATVNAVLHSSEAQMKNARINTGSLYMQNERLFGGLHKDISILGTTVDNIQKITSASLQNIDKNMSEFFTSESKLSSERNSILKEMLEILRANNKSAVDKEKEANSKTKKKIRWADINSSGMPDFDNYIEAIKTNFSKEISSVLPQFGDGEDNNIFAAFATSPLTNVIKPLVSAFIPATFKIASQELDKTLSSVFGQFIGRMANNKNSNGIWQYVAKFLGVNTGVNRSIATNKYEQGPVPFDGITRKAITDVIPSYLRRIEAFLTRSPEQTFDYDAGRWITMRDVQKTHENIHKNAINNGTKEIMDAMKPALDKMKYSNSTDLESFNEAIEEFKQYLYDHNGIFNPNASREKNGIDFANYRNLYNHYNEIVIAYKNFDRTRSVSRGGEKVRNTNYSARLGIANSVLSAKDAEERAYRDLESKISTPMQQYYAAFGIDKHGKWDKDTNKFKSDNLLLNSKDKDGNTVFNYLKNINAELTWQRQAGFEDILSALLSSNVFSNNNKPRGKKRRNRNNNQNSTNENTEFESNLRNLVYSRHNNTFNKIFANLNRNNELEQENNAKTRNRQANLDKAKELIRTGKSVDISVLLKDIENEDEEINKEELEEAVNIINGLLEEHNSKEYKDAVTALNGSGIANTVEKYFFGENVKSIEDFRKEIEKAEKEAEKEKPEREEIEKEKSILSGLLDKVKDAGSLAGGIAGATADVFTNLMYATDRAIYEMMYKTELKDDEDAKEYNGFMDLISGKINKTFEKVGKDLKESIIDPFKKRLGIDEDWTQKFKDSLGNIGSSLWKNFVEANKDIYGPLWGIVKTELGFKDGETIAEKQRRAARRDISDDLKMIDSISSVYDIRYMDMMAEYGLNPIDYGTNFDAAIDALKKAAQARYIKNTNNLKDLSKDHSDDEERKKVIKFANSAQLLEIAAEHGIEQSEVENFKNPDGTWNDEGLRNFIENHIFNKINEDSLRKALNVLNKADEKGNKRFTDEQVERILSGDYQPDWQKETRDLIAQDAINKVKNQSDETLLLNVLNKNKDRYDAFRGKALGLEDNTYTDLLYTLNNNGIDITPFIDDPDSLTPDKAIELLLAANGNNEYILMAKNKGFKYNAENAESNISQVVKAATKYNTSKLSNKSIGEVINNFIDNIQTYNLNKYSNARVKALGFTGSIDEKRAKLKELTGRSDEDLAKYTTDEQLDKEFISFVDAHGLEQIQFAKTFGFASNDRAKQIDQIVTLASQIDDEDLMSSAKSLTNQQLLDKFIELNKINLNEEIAKVLLDGNITKETIINAMGENIAEQLRSDKNLNSEAAWSAEHYRHSHKSMDTNLEIADLMGISSDRSDIEKDIADAAINKVFKQIDPEKTQTGNYTDTFNIVSNILEDGSRIKEAEQNGLKGNLRQKREIAIKFIEAEAERRKKKFEGNQEQIDAINEERDRDIEKIQNATEYDLSDYFVKHGFRNNAEGTLSGKPFMGDTMLSKGELLFNSKGVSRVPKTDAYRLNEPTHILNSEESDNILSMLGVDHKYLANSSIQKDLANENKIKEKLFSDKYIANHADSTVNITNNGVNSNKFLDEAKAYLPEGAAGGLVGGILSLVFNLVGGPLVGAAVGAAGSIISKSDIFKDALFGKKIGDGNERDDSGFISKTIVDKVKKTAPNMFKYGLAGIIPGLITPLGPIGGLIAGAAIGMLRSNEAFTNKYFGEGGKLSIKSEDKEILDKLIPGALKGAGAGAIAGLVFGGPFGLMGNAIIGSALGMMASTSEFKEAMLGTDINGQREGGLVGILKESLSPITDALEEVKSKLVSAVDKHIVDPLERFIRPAIHALPKLLGVVPQFLVDWLDKKTENIRRDLAGKIRDFILPKAEFVGKMLSPITSLATLPFRLPGRIIGGAGDRLRKFDIKHGDLVGMSATEAVEWMDDHKWGNEVDPLLRAAAGVTDKNQAKKAASLLNAMNTTEASAKRNFNDKNHNLNRLLETYKTSDGKRLSKDQINTVLKYAKDEKYDKIAGVLTGMPLNGTNHGMSQEEFNNLMDNKGLRSAISGLAESHKRKELIRTMSNGQITDEAKVALHDLGIDPSTFDITNKKDRAKFAKLLNEQALHLETNPEEEHLAQDNHDNIDNMNDTLTDIYGVLLDYLLGNNRIPKTTGDAADTALGAGINRENIKYRKAYTHIEKSLKRSGMNTDALSDKSKSAITKGYIDKGFGDMSNAHVASSMSAEFINMAVEHDITELDTIAFIDKKLQPLITDEGMQAIANLDKTRLGYLERWLGGSSDIKTAIIKGRYPLDADAINIISSEITTNTQRLEDNCRLINQAKAWDKYKSLKEIDNLSLNDKYVIRGNANVKDTTFSGVFHKDIAAVRDKVWNTVRHPFRTFGRIVNAASDAAEINAAKSRIRNKDREQELSIGEPIASHGLGTFLLSGIGNLAKGIMSLFNKKDDESEGGEKKPGLFNKLLSALPFGKNQAYGDNYAQASYGGGQFDEVDTPNDGKDIAQIGADFAQVKRGSDGSVELDEGDSNTKQIINKLNLKEKIAEKVQQAQLKATEILKNAFDVSDTNEGKNGKLKWWQIALTGAYLWKSGILGRLYNGVVKPVWDTALKPWIVEKAIPWIQNDFIPGIGKFFEDLGITIGNVASFVYTDVLVPAWKDHIKPWFKDTVGPWIMNKFLPEVGRLIGTGVKFIIESLPTIIKGGAVLTGGILDAFTGNTTNVGAVTTVDPSKLTGEGKFTNEKGEELSVEDIQNGNYKKIYNSEGAEGVVNKNGNLEFKDKSFHGSSYLKAAANIGYHALINPRMGMKTADLLVKGGDVTYKTLSHLGMPGKIVGKGAQITGRALSAPTKGAAKLGEKAYSKIFGKSLVKGVDPSKAVESATSLIEQTTGKAGESVIKGTGTAVQEVAETATKKSGIVARMIQKISGFIDNLLSNSKVAQKIAKVAGDLGESSAGKFVKKLKDKVMKVIGEAGEKAAKKMGFETFKDAVSKAMFVISIVQGVIDFGLGWDRAESMLGVTECTTIEKLVCGIVNAVFNYFSILSIVPGVNWTCRTILGFFEKDLKERQAKAEAEYKKYKEQTGSTKTKEEYLASKYSVSGKVGDWTKDKAGKAFEKAKSGVSKAWNGVKNVAGTAWEGTKNIAGKAWNGVKSGASKLKDAAINGVTNAWNGAISGIKDTGFSLLGLLGLGEYYNDNIISLNKDLIINLYQNNKALNDIAKTGDIKALMSFDVKPKTDGNESIFRKLYNTITLGVSSINKIFFIPNTLLHGAINLAKDLFAKAFDVIKKGAVTLGSGLAGLFGFGDNKNDNIINLTKDTITALAIDDASIKALAKDGDIHGVLNYTHNSDNDKDGSIFRTLTNKIVNGASVLKKISYVPEALAAKGINLVKGLLSKAFDAIKKGAVTLGSGLAGLFGFGDNKDDNIINLTKDAFISLTIDDNNLDKLAKDGDIHGVLNYTHNSDNDKDGSIFRALTNKVTGGIAILKKITHVPGALVNKGIALVKDLLSKAANTIKETGKQTIGLFGIGEYGDKNIINIGKNVNDNLSDASDDLNALAKKGEIGSILKYKIDNDKSEEPSIFTSLTNFSTGLILGLKKISSLPEAVIFKGINFISNSITSGISKAKDALSNIKSVASSTSTIIKNGDVSKLCALAPFDNKTIVGTIGNIAYGAIKPVLMVPTVVYKGINLVKDGFNSLTKKLTNINSSDTTSKIESAKKGNISVFSSQYWSNPYDGSNNFGDIMQVIYSRVLKVGNIFTILFAQAGNKIKETISNIENIFPNSVREFFSDPIKYAKEHWFNWGSGSSSDNTAANGGLAGTLKNAATATKNIASSAWDTITGNGTDSNKPRSKYGKGYAKQTDPTISNIRYNDPNDTKYQTIGDSGCGPAAAVNAIEAIKYGKGNNEVANAAKYALNNGYKEKDGGTMPGFFNDYFAKNGYNSQTTYNKQQLKKNIISGAPTVLMGTDPRGVSSSTPYGRYPHYVTATGVDENGHVIIQDPESKYDNQLYSMDDVINNTQFGVSTFGTGKYGKGTEEDIWNYLKNDLKMTDAGAAGLMGNMYAESSLKPNNLEGIYEKKLGMTDKSYTEAVDNGKYSKSKFSNDWAGYGLVQWTYPTRKKALYEYIKAKKLSIASVPGQLGYLNKELSSGYSGVLNTLKSTNTVREASDAVMLKFEKPKDTSEKKRQQRAEYGNKYYTKFSGKTVPSTTTNDTNTSEEESHELGLNDIITLASNLFNSLFSSSDGTASVSSTLYDNNYSTSNSNQAAAIVKVAQGEVGTKESGNNRVKYVDWYYGKSGKSMAWCCAFVAWCANQAGISTSIIPKEASCSVMYKGLLSRKAKVVSDSNIKPGDLMFVTGGSTGYKHIGIVESVSGNDVNTIEGNSTNMVKRVKRSINDKTIVIVRPAYATASSNATASLSTGTGTFPKYNLTDAQIKGVANIIQHEQPDMKGYLAEASLMANLTDINGDKYATSENLVKKATGGWFAYGKSRFNNPGNPKASAIQAAKTVLVDGKRTLPRYINEHDCFSDIKSATNNGKSINKKDRSSYKQHVTKVKNTYGSNWTFYEFPSNKSDPFGYTSSNNRSKWGDFHYDANSLTSGYGTNSGVKPLAKYGQFKDSIYGKGSIYRSPYKNSLSIDKEIKLVNAEQSHEFGNGTSNYTNKKYGNGTYTESNNTAIINLINAVIKVLYEIADNTDKLNTIVSILNENLNINITAKDVSDNTGKYDTLKSKLRKSLNGAANSTLNNSYANTVNNSSMSAVIEIMNNIAAE